MSGIFSLDGTTLISVRHTCSYMTVHTWLNFNIYLFGWCNSTARLINSQAVSLTQQHVKKNTCTEKLCNKDSKSAWPNHVDSTLLYCLDIPHFINQLFGGKEFLLHSLLKTYPYLKKKSKATHLEVEGGGVSYECIQ